MADNGSKRCILCSVNEAVPGDVLCSQCLAAEKALLEDLKKKREDRGKDKK